MAPPLVRQPILPVLNDIVHGNAATAELRKRRDQFILRGIALPALPEAQGPFGQHLRFAGQLPVAPDHAVIIVSRDEIEVQLRLELGPETDPLHLFGGLERRNPQADIGNGPVRLPLDPNRHPNPGFQPGAETIAVGIPGRTPAAGHHFPPIHQRTLKAGIILGETVVTPLRSLDKPFIDDLRSVQVEIRQLADGPFILKEKTVLPPDQPGTIRGRVSAGQGPFHTVLIV